MEVFFSSLPLCFSKPFTLSKRCPLHHSKRHMLLLLLLKEHFQDSLLGLYKKLVFQNSATYYQMFLGGKSIQGDKANVAKC